MYFLIGISLLLATFYVVHVAAALVAAGTWHIGRGPASRLSGRAHSDVIFLLKVLPAAIAALLTFGMVVPGFLLYEPATPKESVSYVLGTLAAISALGFAVACGRALVSWRRTRCLVRTWTNGASDHTIDGIKLPVSVMEHPFPVIAVVGILKPRVFVCERVLRSLDPAEFRASIAHEVGHLSSHDNLKKTLISFCSDLLVLPIGRELDRAWTDAAETAADDAVTGSGNGALALASALVKIGRLVPPGASPTLPAGAYLVEPYEAPLAGRIRRLVAMSGMPALSDRTASAIRRGAAITTAIAVAFFAYFAMDPVFLARIHEATEKVLAALR